MTTAAAADTGDPPRGLLLLDVDGPLFPWRNKDSHRPAGYASHRRARDGRWYSDRRDFRRHKGTYIWLHPGHGRHILELAADTGLRPVWATTWLHEANERIAPAIGLPELPVIGFGPDALNPPTAKTAWKHTGPWKYAAVGEYAAGLPLAWFDDEFDMTIALIDVMPGRDRHDVRQHRTRAREAFLADRHGTPTLLCQVDPSTGLTDRHFEQVRAWAAALPAPAAVPAAPTGTAADREDAAS